LTWPSGLARSGLGADPRSAPRQLPGGAARTAAAFPDPLPPPQLRGSEAGLLGAPSFGPFHTAAAGPVLSAAQSPLAGQGSLQSRPGQLARPGLPGTIGLQRHHLAGAGTASSPRGGGDRDGGSPSPTW
ncbi:hypothetical protein H1C71_041690, partial [Ictidomys tridecemlineatus]